jgi:hypothetical protein
MKLYELIPEDTADPGWKYSTYCGAVIVRAEDKQKARQAATLAFGRAAQVYPYETTSHQPWDLNDVVSARAVSSSRFSASGPAGVLDPAQE